MTTESRQMFCRPSFLPDLSHAARIRLHHICIDEPGTTCCALWCLPVLTPHVASPRLALRAALTVNPLRRNNSTVGSCRHVGALYPGSSSLQHEPSGHAGLCSGKACARCMVSLLGKFILGLGRAQASC